MSTLFNDPFQGKLNRLTPDDCRSFHQYASLRSVCYANSWLYHLRSARNQDGSLGYHCHGEGFFATFGLRDSFATCVSPMGQDRFAQTLQLCRLIGAKAKLPVVIKKVDAELQRCLLQQEGFSICSDDRLMEDEAFPEHYLDLMSLFDEKCQLSRKAKQLQRRVRQFDLQNVKLFATDEFDSKPDGIVAALERLASRKSSKHQAYFHLCRFVQAQEISRDGFFCKVYVDHNHHVHGLYIAQRLEDETAGLYCAITSRAYSYATERMDVAFFQWLRQMGIRKLMLGGSETAGVHHYVQKLLPIQMESSSRPLIYHVPAAEVQRAESTELVNNFS